MITTSCDCSPLPPNEPGCEWVYSIPESCQDNQVQCLSGFAVIGCNGVEVQTNAPCTNEGGYLDIDYTVCGGTITRVWMEE